MIPLRFIPHGDKHSCKELYGFSRKIYGQLKRAMEFQNLNVHKSPIVHFADGSTVQVFGNYGIFEAHIFRPLSGALREITERKCLCFPHFAFGVVTAVYPPIPEFMVNPEDGSFLNESQEAFEERLATYQSFLIDGRFQYDIDVCAKDIYLSYEKALDANYGRYYKDQYVMVTIGEEMEEWASPLDCDRPCLSFLPRFDRLTIAPIHVTGLMKEWLYQNRIIRA